MPSKKLLISDVDDVERCANRIRMMLSARDTHISEEHRTSLDADVTTAYGMMLNVESKIIELLVLTTPADELQS